MQKKYDVFIHGRNKEKVNQSIQEIKENSNNNNIFGFVSDFSDLEDVKKLSKEINSKINKLDYLVISGNCESWSNEEEHRIELGTEMVNYK